MAHKTKTMPIKLLHQLLICDRQTGKLTWKPRPPSMFPKEHYCKSWNKRHAGKPALSYVSKDGYCVGTILNKSFQAHRVVYAMRNGDWPVAIDHENGNRSNNSHDEIRPATFQQNCQNHRLRADNKSGVCGVHLRHGKWVAHIRVNTKLIHLGSFVLKDDAVKVRKDAEAKYGFHPNHGRSR